MEDLRDAKSADFIYEVENVFFCSIATLIMWYWWGRELKWYELIAIALINSK